MNNLTKVMQEIADDILHGKIETVLCSANRQSITEELFRIQRSTRNALCSNLNHCGLGQVRLGQVGGGILKIEFLSCVIFVKFEKKFEVLDVTGQFFFLCKLSQGNMSRGRMSQGPGSHRGKLSWGMMLQGKVSIANLSYNRKDTIFHQISMDESQGIFQQ